MASLASIQLSATRAPENDEIAFREEPEVTMGSLPFELSRKFTPDEEHVLDQVRRRFPVAKARNDPCCPELDDLRFLEEAEGPPPASVPVKRIGIFFARASQAFHDGALDINDDQGSSWEAGGWQPLPDAIDREFQKVTDQLYAEYRGRRPGSSLTLLTLPAPPRRSLPR